MARSNTQTPAETRIEADAPNAATREALKEVQAPYGMWWKVELVTNAVSDPIRVRLMESHTPGRKGLSRCLVHGRTTASTAKVKELAENLLAMVVDYEKVVGSYDEPS